MRLAMRRKRHLPTQPPVQPEPQDQQESDAFLADENGEGIGGTELIDIGEQN